MLLHSFAGLIKDFKVNDRVCVENKEKVACRRHFLTCDDFVFPQGSSQRVPTKEERIREVFREQSCCFREPEQNIDRRTESFKRPILPQSRLSAENFR
jgi:hypothetical protein